MTGNPGAASGFSRPPTAGAPAYVARLGRSFLRISHAKWRNGLFRAVFHPSI